MRVHPNATATVEPITPLRTKGDFSAVFSPSDGGSIAAVVETIRALTLLVVIALCAPVARAAEIAYPPGSRIGIVPPAGMVTSNNFFGYVDPDNNVAIMLVALPIEAYADLDKSVGAEALKRQGLTMESREAMPLAVGNAFLVIGHQEIEKIK